MLAAVSISKMEITWKLTTAFLWLLEEQTCMPISNAYTSTATIRKQPLLVHERQEVLMITAKRVRSRMR